MRAIDGIVNSLTPRFLEELPQPYLRTKPPRKAMLAVKGMEHHTSDEGWQLTKGLEASGYKLIGPGFGWHYRNVNEFVIDYSPEILVIQDKREWDPSHVCCLCPEGNFNNIGYLKNQDSIFKLTVLKDAHQNPEYHRISAEEAGVHAWITYYHPKVVKRLAPFVREKHLIRTYHSIDADKVPEYSPFREGVILSGATGEGYPLRNRLFAEADKFRHLHVAPHIGYQAKVSDTNRYLNLLSRFKVAICTSSQFGYLLRKIIEATACGCRVVTDLPADERVPEIDGNLIRIDSHASTEHIVGVVEKACKNYHPETQKYFAAITKKYFDYRVLGRKLSDDIESLRATYNREDD